MEDSFSDFDEMMAEPAPSPKEETPPPQQKRKKRPHGPAQRPIDAYNKGDRPTAAMERGIVSRRQKKLYAEFRNEKITEYKKLGDKASDVARRVAEDEHGKQRSTAAMLTAKASVASVASAVAKSDRVYTGKAPVEGNPEFNTSNSAVKVIERVSKSDAKRRYDVTAEDSDVTRGKGDPPGAQMLQAYAKNPEKYKSSIGALATAARKRPSHLLKDDEYESACIPDKRHVTSNAANSFGDMLDEVAAVENGSRVKPPQKLSFERNKRRRRSAALSAAVINSICEDADAADDDDDDDDEEDEEGGRDSGKVRSIEEFMKYRKTRDDIMDYIEREKIEEVAAELGTKACDPDDDTWNATDASRKRQRYRKEYFGRTDKFDLDSLATGVAEDGDDLRRVNKTRPSMVRALLSSAANDGEIDSDEDIEGTEARKESQTSAQLSVLLNLIKDALRTDNMSALTPDLRRNISDLMRRDETIRTMFETGNVDSKLIASISMLIFNQIGLVRDKKKRDAMQREAREYIEARNKSNLESGGGVDRVLSYHAQRVSTLIDDIRRKIHGVSLRGLSKNEKENTVSALYNPVTDTFRRIACVTAHPDDDMYMTDPTFIKMKINRVRGSLDVPAGGVKYDDDTVSFAVMQTEMNEASDRHSIHALFWDNESTRPIVERYTSTIPLQTVEWLHEMMRQPHPDDPYAVPCASPVCCGLSNSIVSTFPKFRLHAFYMSGEDFGTTLQEIFVKNKMRMEQGIASRIPAERVEEIQRLLHIHGTEKGCDPDIERRMRKCALEILKRRCVMCIIRQTSELFNGNNKRATKRRMDEARAKGDSTNFKRLQREYERPIHPFVVPAGKGGFAASALLAPTTENTVFSGIVGPFPMWDETALSLCEITDSGSFYGYRFKPSNFC